MHFKLSKLLLGLALTSGTVFGFWRMTCDHPLVVGRIDPIVSPGKVSGHIHTISGGSALNFSMTYAGARTSTCSTCMIKQDLSNYWYALLTYVVE